MPFVLQQNISLAPYTTLRVGGRARFFAEIATEGELIEALHIARQQGLRTFTLGGGSNLLVPDSGCDGLVLHIAIQGALLIDGVKDSFAGSPTITYSVPAGMVWDDFVRMVCEAGISGIECLAGIPGLVGGSPVQNIGAYGQEVAATITSVRALDLATLDFLDLPASACAFAYRSSLFNTTHCNRYILTRVTFRFQLNAQPTLNYVDLQKHFASASMPPTPLDVYHAVRGIRHAKGMLLVEGESDCRSAGSFFKNPIIAASLLRDIAATLNMPADTIPHWTAGQGRIKLSAAWLLDQAGFHKGFTLGEAGISSRHTLALINRGHATFADMARLRDAIQSEVERRFKVSLEQEPVQFGV